MAKLYNWRYRALGDLPAVSTAPAFVAANPGFGFEYQFVHVPDFMGKVSLSLHPYHAVCLFEACVFFNLFFARCRGCSQNLIKSKLKCQTRDWSALAALFVPWHFCKVRFTSI